MDLEEEDGVSVKVHWIGSDDAEVVILYLHGTYLGAVVGGPGVFFLWLMIGEGGGYTQPCSPGHLEYIHRLVTDLNKGAKTVSVLLLAYTLVPEARFPTQLKQAAGALSFLLREGKRSPRDILVSGDSAGGNLAISLLSHLLHPHSDVPKVAIDVPLRGLFVYSPWVSFDTSDETYIRNASKDVLVPSVLRKWSGMYIGTVDDETDPGTVAVGDVYNEPLRADASWWKEMHKIVMDVWLWGGDDEVFIDSLRAFGEKFRRGWMAGGGVEERLTLEFVENDMHIGPIMDVELQYKEKSKTQLRLEEWLEERLI